MVPENLLKQRIKDGEVVVALRVPVEIERHQLEVALSKDTFHLLYIDGQHTGFSDAQVVSFCSIAEDLGLPVQFRIPHTRHTYLAPYKHCCHEVPQGCQLLAFQSA